MSANSKEEKLEQNDGEALESLQSSTLKTTLSEGSINLNQFGWKEFFLFSLTALFESLGSALGIFMTGLILAEKFHGGSSSLYICLVVALLFGLLISVYTYKLLKLKAKEENGNGIKNSQEIEHKKRWCAGCLLFLSFLSIVGLLLTTFAAGLDAGSALFQQGISSTSKSSMIAFLCLGAVSLFCRSAKYYICDLGTQVPENKLIGLDRWFRKKASRVGKVLRGAVFQLFPFGEAIAHLLAAYIVYSDLVSPYFLNDNISNIFKLSTPHIVADFLLTAGVLIGLFAFFTQYVIICAADLEWGASTLDPEKKNISKEIDNRFGAIGRFLLWSFPAILRVYRCTNAKNAHKRLIRGMWWSKILGQGILLGAALILLVSIVFVICNGLSPTQTAGSIPVAWYWVSFIFLAGFVAGACLGYRQWKAKNANHEVDLFVASLVLNKNKYIGDNTLNQDIAEWRKKRTDNRKTKKTWIETKQVREKNKKNGLKILPYIISLFFGSILGALYGYEKLDLSFNKKLIKNIHFDIYAAMGGLGFLFITFLILSNRKDVLHKTSDVPEGNSESKQVSA